MSVKRIQLIIAYDGSNYHGFAKQNNAVTIQAKVEEAIKRITGQAVELIGSGRTDAGVHAKNQCCIIDIDTKIPIRQFARALNSKLPNDIVVREATYVKDDFHPRFMAKKKTYTYQILVDRVRDPFLDKYVYFYPIELDLDRMKEAAKFIKGTHDFKCFCASGSSVKGTVRTVYEIEVFKQDQIITIEICGDGFLYNMVRIIAGTLIEIGRGRFEPEYMKTIIESCDRGAAGPTAPPQGLCLKEVFYEDSLRYDINTL